MPRRKSIYLRTGEYNLKKLMDRGFLRAERFPNKPTAGGEEGGERRQTVLATKDSALERVLKKSPPRVKPAEKPQSPSALSLTVSANKIRLLETLLEQERAKRQQAERRLRALQFGLEGDGPGSPLSSGGVGEDKDSGGGGGGGQPGGNGVERGGGLLREPEEEGTDGEDKGKKKARFKLTNPFGGRRAKRGVRTAETRPRTQSRPLTPPPDRFSATYA